MFHMKPIQPTNTRNETVKNLYHTKLNVVLLVTLANLINDNADKIHSHMIRTVIITREYETRMSVFVTTLL
jgi:hypothetical protein